MRLLSFSRIALALGLLPLCTAAAAPVEPAVQTDWSGGSNVPGPVLSWGNSFDQQSETAWRSIPGQIALAGTQRSPARRVVVTENADLPRGAAAGDLNGDGRTDLVIGDPVTDPFNPVGAIYWWQAEAEGEFIERVVSDTFHGTNHLTTADVDGDGDTDVVAAAYYGEADPPPPPPPGRNGRFAWFENVSGDGSIWTEHLVGEMFWGAEYVDVGDFDGDGDIDLVGASYLTRGVYEQESDITWFENLEGTGDSWQMHEVSGEFDNGYEAHFADLDSDGDLDILGTHADLISWWENTTGNGDILEFHLINDGLQNVGYVNVGDLDNDGDQDVVGSTYSSSSLLWWENLIGDASLWALHIIGPHSGGEQVEVVDIEGDGDLDIVADRRSGSGAALTVFTNSSGDASNWVGRTVQYESNTDYSIAIADADSDGKIDVVVASEDYYRQLGKQVSFFDLSIFGTFGILRSSVLDGGLMPGWETITWETSVPEGASLTVDVRAANESSDLGPFVEVPASGTDLSALIDDDARYLQYRLTLSGGGDLSPVIRELIVEQSSGGNGLVLAGPQEGRAGDSIELVAQSREIGARIYFAGAITVGQSPVPPCPDVMAGLDSPRRIGSAAIGLDGEARLTVSIPRAAQGKTLYFQALHHPACVISNVIGVPIE